MNKTCSDHEKTTQAFGTYEPRPQRRCTSFAVSTSSSADASERHGGRRGGHWLLCLCCPLHIATIFCLLGWTRSGKQLQLSRGMQWVKKQTECAMRTTRITSGCCELSHSLPAAQNDKNSLAVVGNRKISTAWRLKKICSSEYHWSIKPAGTTMAWGRSGTAPQPIKQRRSAAYMKVSLVQRHVH